MRAFGEATAGARAVLAVAGASLFVVLVAWGTLIGPDEVFTGPGPRPATLTTTTERCIPLPTRTAPDGTVTVEIPDDLVDRDYCQPPATPGTGQQRQSDADVPLWAKVLVWAVEALVLLGIVVAIGWALLRLRELWRHRPRPDDEVVDDPAFDVLPEPARLAAAIAEDAEEQDQLLRDGDARNAIVAAWSRFEVQGARAGLPRRSWETSSEYTLRILEVADADTGAVQRLATLFREARFSDHPVTEAHRDAALAALAEVRRSLQVRP